ncbi:MULTISPECIES: hypothetical protein [Paraburkholderia]|jgi:hypothetical protein|uniref:DUF4148 domain-containing protein n=1 Tax=Paraburkholderia largidicola TaxID=3014751 RepID=A0A7I8BMP3_9BURK|nr:MULTISPECIES: hypothetical protein [Paraburkholderia]BEU22503.1 hypothetical protein PBP221_26430 [Paraburkholderia sp. 22B1P]GJH38221.1 hypothetical protein CBA19CS91_35710 [Paraburkholderia hospita]CAG9242511.1 conserved exported hypothetical protein [Paraburkholderia caribensis]BCF89539.1 hypothetical protein PPGU16_26060 [Paraburkholderia sp. PGU16]GJH05453.1 hypothetical protein CBA19C8_32870 [Paraburkholderia terrae]
MAAHLRSRQRPARVHPLRVGLRSRVLLLAAALASALALMPHAHAQDNPAQGNGQNAAAPKGNANANPNGAPARKTASQRSQEDAQRLLGGPSATLGGYDPGGATPDSQRDALLNSERMRVAKPNTQAMGGPTALGGGAAPAGGGAIRRPARGAAAGGGAGDNGGAAGAAAQRAAAVNAANAGGGATVYSSPYSERAGREVFKSPW